VFLSNTIGSKDVFKIFYLCPDSGVNADLWPWLRMLQLRMGYNRTALLHLDIQILD